MSVWAAILLMFGVSMVTAEGYPLDMAVNSVDDMYDGCEEKMYQKVEKELLEKEKSTNEKFRDAWKEAEMHYNEKKITPPPLERAELVAMYVYTNASTGIYRELNTAVREQGPEYKTTFNYHSLHYFLTSVLRKHKKCYTAYRRTNAFFSQDPSKKIMRFGYFTSSSKYPLESIQSKNMTKDYGEKSCFIIETCFGADIAPYSVSSEAEAEILIPPYEVFKVTKTETREKKKELPCEVVYTVKSTKKTVSNYNCAFFKSSLSHA